MRSSHWLGTIALVVAAIAAYHLVVARPPGHGAPANGADAERLAERLDDLERRLARAENAPRTAPAANGSLDARVRELETALRAGRGPTPATDASQPARWTEGDIAALRSMLEEVDRRRRIETQRKQVETMVDRAVADQPAETRTAIVDRVVAYIEEVRAIQTEGAANARTTEERKALADQLENLRAKLSLDLERSFPDVGPKLLKALPWTQPRGLGPVPPR
jgi:hypothetical protein